jgi:hypothetical protein
MIAAVYSAPLSAIASAIGHVVDDLKFANALLVDQTFHAMPPVTAEEPV